MPSIRLPLITFTALSLLVTGCGPLKVPSSPPPGLAGDQVGNSITTAYKNASAVHVKGYLIDGGTKITLDIQSNRDGSAGGTISDSGAAVPVRRVDGVTYMQFTKSLIEQQHLPTAANSAMLGKWVASNTSFGNGMATSFSPMLSYDSLLDHVLGGFRDQAYTDPTGTGVVDGVPVTIYRDSSGEADVATAAPHYLIRIIAKPADKGTLDFTGWNQPVKIIAPPKSEIFSVP